MDQVDLGVTILDQQGVDPLEGIDPAHEAQYLGRIGRFSRGKVHLFVFRHVCLLPGNQPRNPACR